MKIFFRLNQKLFFAGFIAASILTGCYRMPSENEYSVVPRTNNPDLIRERPNTFTPAVNY
jgi:hypothetical protein